MNLNMLNVSTADKNYHGYRLFASDLRKRLSQQGWSESNMIQHVGFMWGNLSEAQKSSWSESARMMAYEHLQRTFPENMYLVRPSNAGCMSDSQSVANMNIGSHSLSFPQPVPNGFCGMQQGLAASSWSSQGHALQRALPRNGAVPNQQSAGTLTQFSVPSSVPHRSQRSPQSQMNQNALVPSFSLPTQTVVRPPVSPVQGRMQIFPNGPYQQPSSCIRQQENIPTFAQRSPREMMQPSQPQRPQTVSSSVNHVNHVVHYSNRFPRPSGVTHNALLSCRQPLQQIPHSNNMNTRQISHQRMLPPAQGSFVRSHLQSTSSNLQSNPVSQKIALNMSDVFDESPTPPGQAFKKIIIEVNGVRKTILVPTASQEVRPVSETQDMLSTSGMQTPTSTRASLTQSAELRNQNFGYMHSMYRDNGCGQFEAQRMPNATNSYVTGIHRAASEKTCSRTTNQMCSISPSGKKTNGNGDSQINTAIQDDDSLPDKNGDVSRLTVGMSNQVRELLKGIFDNYKDTGPDQVDKTSTCPLETSFSQEVPIPSFTNVPHLQTSRALSRESNANLDCSTTLNSPMVTASSKQVTNISANSTSASLSSTHYVKHCDANSASNATGILDICNGRLQGSKSDDDVLQSIGNSLLRTPTTRSETLVQDAKTAACPVTANSFRHESVTICNEQETGAIVLTIRNQERIQKPIAVSEPSLEANSQIGERNESAKPHSTLLEIDRGSTKPSIKDDKVPTLPSVFDKTEENLSEAESAVKGNEPTLIIPKPSLVCGSKINENEEYIPRECSDQSDDSDEMVCRPLKRRRGKIKNSRKYRRILTMKEKRNSRRILDSETSDTQDDSDFELFDTSSSSDDDDMCCTRKSARAAAKAAKSAIGQLISLETATSPNKDGIGVRTRRDKFDYWGQENLKNHFDEEKARLAFRIKDCRVVLRQLDMSKW